MCLAAYYPIHSFSQCSATASVTSPILCNGGTATVTVVATGGVVPYSYTFDIQTNTTGIFTGISAGTYSISVIDNNNCTATTSITITQPNTLSASIAGTNLTCNANNSGTANLTVTGGTIPYTFLWSNTATTEDLTGLAAGTFSVTVTDSNSCTATDTVTITEPDVLSATLASTHVTCNGAGNGTITISGPAGGYGTYEYSIDGGASWQGSGSYTGLGPATFNILIRDSANSACTSTLDDALVITQPTTLSASIAGTNLTCNANNSGTANLTVTGGTIPYTFLWSNTATTEDLSGLAAGTFSVTVTDSNNCTTTNTVTITEPDVLSATLASTHVTCNGAGNGTITISGPAGGYGTYEYSIDGGASWQGSGSYTGLGPATYNVLIRDSANPSCSKVLSSSLVLTQPTILNAFISSTTNVLCFSNSTGAATVTASGGTGTLGYTWNTAPVQTSATATGLAAGTYLVTVTDANGCTANATAIITQPASALSFNSPVVSAVTCTGKNDGRIQTSSSGGTGTVTYTISPNIGNQSPDGIFNNLTAGTYTVSATDQNGCQTSTTIDVGTVADTIPPVISGCPSGPVIAYTGAGSTTCQQTVTWTEPAAMDNCTGAMTFTTRTVAPGSTFTVGSTIVTYTFTDPSNNTSTCSFTVTVVDNTPPTFVTPLSISVYSNISCLANTLPGSTGSPISVTDNCTPTGNLTISHVDSSPVPGACPGSYSFTRTWMVGDASGNSHTDTQVITVVDNIKPILTTPSDISLQCGQSNLPDNTGMATATDNCGETVTITYTDVITSGSCPGNYYIARTWKATDCSGNYSTSKQNITVTDATKPVITGVQNITVSCPSDIPMPDPAAITATDNCGGVTILLFEEIPNGLSGKPGYCPTSVTRIFRVTDACGNYTDATQTITVLGPCGCSPCTNGTAFYLVDLDNDPTGTITISNAGRDGLCCDAARPSRCISFNIRLDEDAVGMEIIIDGASPDMKDWKIDCDDISIIGNIVCIPKGDFHLFTFCKQGSNTNSFTFRSIAGVIASEDIVARIDCQGQLTTNGIVSNPTWTSVFPGVEGQYNSYLSCLNCMNPMFTADTLAPPIIKYKICGNIGVTVCTETGIDCDTISVFIKKDIEIELNVNAQLLCQGTPASISAIVSPSANYTYEWFTGYNAIGVPFSTESSFAATAAGQFSVKVTDTQDGVPCSSSVFNFDVGYDVLGPTIFAPPAGDLNIECNNPNALQLINNWLASASASYIKPDGTVVDLVPENDFTSITMACGTILPVVFTAVDQCNNARTASANIRIIDTNPPVIACPADVSGNTGGSQCFATGIQLGTATATDNCSTPSVTNNAPDQYPVGITQVTWTATDNCGNSATCVQKVTISDNQAPVLTCPAPVVVTATAPSCVFPAVVIGPLAASDNCGISTVSWTKTGATAASGTGDVNGTSFNVGVTSVTYTATDINGNISNCTFTVTVRDQVPPLVITCPSDVTRNIDANSCTAAVIVPAPVVVDPCGEIVSVRNSFNNTADASGTYPAGITPVTWTFTDESGNTTTCPQTITIIDNIIPTISCPADVVQTLLDEGCLLSDVTISNPTFFDNCSVNLTWVMSGATTGSSPATGINYAGGQTFHVGITLVTYTITDISGNSASCSFQVWIKDLVKPVFSIACPVNITQDADSAMCSAAVTVPIPLVSDPCDELVSIVNSFNGTDNASGTYPIGTTSVTWTITDLSGNPNTCIQTISIVDLLPTLTCPADVNVKSNFNMGYATDVEIGAPVYSDNCSGLTLTWVSSNPTPGASPLTGINIDTVSTYYAGVTTITYTLTDTNNHTATCSFTVTVMAKPEILCPNDTVVNNDPGLCSASIDPGFATKISGAEPITWTWAMTGATAAGGTGNPIEPIPYIFNAGQTTITWIATNISGTDTCSQLVTVTDNEPPTFNAPPGPFAFCVVNLSLASIVSSNLQINPEPDYYLFNAGDKALDLDSIISNFNDNCCTDAQLEIHWRIDFTDTPNPTPPPALLSFPPISGTGQPSAYGADIHLPGDGVNFSVVNHKITYWLIDCHNNRSTDHEVTITIKPRPQVVKN